MEDLESLTVVNGVNENMEGFVTITAQGSKGTLLLGQMSIDQCRKQGLIFVEIAEAALQDSVTFKVLNDLFSEEHETAEQMSALIITKLREEREH